MELAKLIPTMRSSIILFPGQGSQYVGMVKHLCARGRSLFEMANEVLGYNLLKLCQEGPEEDLNRTVHSQPAMLVSSLAAVERLASLSQGAVEKCTITAGFSVGEFAALVLAQSIDFVDALRLLKIRAESSQVVSNTIPSGMMTVLYGNNANISQACALAQEYCVRSGLPVEESICSIANYLFPHGKVIGGHQKALEFIEQNGRDFGIKRMKRLAVSGAFHTKLMQPVCDDLRTALKKIEIKEPKIKVYSNIDASIYTSAEQIRKQIVRHVAGPVRWEQIIRDLYENSRNKEEEFPVTFECGPGDNMTNILGMINLKAKKLAYNIEP